MTTNTTPRYYIEPTPPPQTSDIEADGGKWIQLDDGRIVEYFVFGSQNSDARILIDCPGGGSTGHWIGRIPGVVEWLETNKVRAISLSYPGFGRSQVQQGWVIGDWPKTDLEPVLKQEDIKGKFYVTGTSVGTPHAQAILHCFPDRVEACGLRVPFIGRVASQELGLPLGQAEMKYTSTSVHDSLLGHIAGRFTMSMCSEPHKFFDEPSKAMKLFLSCMQPHALQTMETLLSGYPAEMQAAKIEMERGVVCGAQGWLYMCAMDTLLDHGFDVRDISKDTKMVVWYATDDEDCPPSHGEWLVKHFTAHVRKFTGTGHVGGSLIDFPDFLDAVISNSSNE